MSLEVKQTLSIGDDLVELETSFSDLTIYKSTKSERDGELLLYFVQNGVVIQKLHVEADYGQASGYVSDYSFSEVTHGK